MARKGSAGYRRWYRLARKIFYRPHEFKRMAYVAHWLRCRGGNWG